MDVWWRYRLKLLASSGKVYTKVTGNWKYVWDQAQRARQSSRGRQWIERTDTPAITGRNRRARG